MDQYLEPFDEAVTDTRNATKLSRFSERLVRTFLDYHAAEASVNFQLTEYDIETLYKGLWNVCAKDGFRGLVRVHKQDGHLLLIQEKRGKR